MPCCTCCLRPHAVPRCTCCLAATQSAEANAPVHQLQQHTRLATVTIANGKAAHIRTRGTESRGDKSSGCNLHSSAVTLKVSADQCIHRLSVSRKAHCVSRLRHVAQATGNSQYEQHAYDNEGSTAEGVRLVTRDTNHGLKTDRNHTTTAVTATHRAATQPTKPLPPPPETPTDTNKAIAYRACCQTRRQDGQQSRSIRHDSRAKRR